MALGTDGGVVALVSAEVIAAGADAEGGVDMVADARAAGAGTAAAAALAAATAARLEGAGEAWAEDAGVPPTESPFSIRVM